MDVNNGIKLSNRDLHQPHEKCHMWSIIILFSVTPEINPVFNGVFVAQSLFFMFCLVSYFVCIYFYDPNVVRLFLTGIFRLSLIFFLSLIWHFCLWYITYFIVYAIVQGWVIKKLRCRQCWQRPSFEFPFDAKTRQQLTNWHILWLFASPM